MLNARAGLILVFAALFVIAFSWYFWMDANIRLRHELDALEERFERVRKEHELALAAASQALAARNEINEKYLDRARWLEEALASPDCAVPVPVSLRLRLQPDAAAAGAAAGADSPAGSFRHSDNGGHGQSDTGR